MNSSDKKKLPDSPCRQMEVPIPEELTEKEGKEDRKH
jgi:hypothetical protein